MSAQLAGTLGQQRESDAQRRVDAAVRFAVWACTRDSFPSPAEIQDEFGVSRRTAGRWRKSLTRALGSTVAASRPKLDHDRAKRLLPRGKAARVLVSDLARVLAADAALLALPDATVARDVRDRYPSIGRAAAQSAINDARRRVAVDSASRGATAVAP